MNSPAPAVSVIVPVFNGERYLAEAIASIVGQDCASLEVLVVDDGSTDRSASVAAGFPGVTLLRKAHSGLAATLNHGVDHATGELLAFLDADDRWLPGKLSRQAEALRQQPELDLVFCLTREFSVRTAPAGDETVYSAAKQGICKSGMLIRHAAFRRVGGFTEHADRHDFLDWYARAQSAGITSAVLPELLIERRIHDRNMGRTQAADQRALYLATLRAAVARRRLRNDGG